MTPAESIALAVLQHYSGVWYTSENDTQRQRVLRDATAAIEPMIAAFLSDPVALRANILRHGPPGFDLYSAEHIERIKAEAVLDLQRE